MKVVCRVDDLGWGVAESATPPIKQPDVGLVLAQGFHAAMGGAPYLGAVIPSRLDAEALAWLRSKPEGLAIALHGWDHGSGCPNERDEFAPLGPTATRDRICWGQRLIGPTPFFVPPYNALPPVLLEQAPHEDIKYIFSGPSRWPTPPTPYEVGRLWIVPAWHNLYGGSRFRQGESPSIMESLDALDLDGPGHAVVCLHIGWEAARHPDFAGVRELIGRIREHLISPAEYVAQACGGG